jgi:cell division protein FtsI/penicillin-binding protein 2
VVCTGGYRYGNRVFRCWEHRGHGAQDMHNAIKNSCDVYFYHMCNRAGVDLIQDTAKKIGFMQTYDIGVGNQKAGTIPSKAWKANYNKPQPESGIPGLVSGRDPVRRHWPGRRQRHRPATRRDDLAHRQRAEGHQPAADQVGGRGRAAVRRRRAGPAVPA